MGRSVSQVSCLVGDLLSIVLVKHVDNTEANIYNAESEGQCEREHLDLCYSFSIENT